MKAVQVVEVLAHKDHLPAGHYSNGWHEIARLVHSFPDEYKYSFYNEAYFDTSSGLVWARRRWLDKECSWWINIRSCETSPFDFYDLSAGLSSTPNVQEYLVNEFLRDPTIAGYTASSFPCSSSGSLDNGRPR